MNNSKTRICIAGAGVMGLCAAHALQRRFPQSEMTLKDAPSKNAQGFPPARSASMIAGGMLAPYSEIEHLPPDFMQAALAGMRFWEGLPTGETGFARTGTLLLAHAQDVHMLERFRKKLSGLNNWSDAGKKEIAALEPFLDGRFEEGIYIPEEAHLCPPLALENLAAGCARKISEAYDVTAEASRFDWVIDCRGYAAATDDPGLRGVKGEVALVRNPEFSLTRPVRLMHPRYPLYIVPRPNHEFLIGATLIESEGKTITLKSAMELLSAAYSLHPSFGDAEIIGILSGVRPAYPDNLPRIKIRGNVVSCNGLFRHGYLLAPAMAACAADFIRGQESEFAHLFIKETNDRYHQRPAERIKRRA